MVQSGRKINLDSMIKKNLTNEDREGEKLPSEYYT